MAADSIKKNKKTETKKPVIAKKTLKADKVSVIKSASSVKKSASHFDYLILHPHITEKAHDISPLRQYIFIVSGRANKSEVKKIISTIYKVDVVKVRIINTAEKPRRLGRNVGVKAGYKKAIVTLKEGQSIEITPNKQ